jgi:hypothetical protein
VSSPWRLGHLIALLTFVPPTVKPEPGMKVPNAAARSRGRTRSLITSQTTVGHPGCFDNRVVFRRGAHVAGRRHRLPCSARPDIAVVRRRTRRTRPWPRHTSWSGRTGCAPGLRRQAGFRCSWRFASHRPFHEPDVVSRRRRSACWRSLTDGHQTGHTLVVKNHCGYLAAKRGACGQRAGRVVRGLRPRGCPRRCRRRCRRPPNSSRVGHMSGHRMGSTLSARKTPRGYEVSDSDVRALAARRSAGYEPPREVRTHQRQGRPRGTAVTATPPGERHALPGMMAAACLREDHWHVHHLAADLPVADVIRLAADTGASSCCLWLPTAPPGSPRERPAKSASTCPLLCCSCSGHGVHEPAAGRHADQDRGQRASSPPTSSSENLVRPPTAVSMSNPAVVSMLNWTVASAASPPGRQSVTAFPASPAVTTANQPLVRSASRCKAKLQANASAQ